MSEHTSHTIATRLEEAVSDSQPFTRIEIPYALSTARSLHLFLSNHANIELMMDETDLEKSKTGLFVIHTVFPDYAPNIESQRFVRDHQGAVDSNYLRNILKKFAENVLAAEEIL